MAEDTEINVGGTWKSIDNCEVNVGSAWKQVETIEVNVGGTWKTVWQNLVFTLSGETISDNNPTNSRQVTAAITIDSDGNVYKIVNTTTTQIDTGTDWVRPTTDPTIYYVRFTKDAAGDTPTVGALLEGTWSSTTTDRTYGYQHSSDDTEQSDSNLTIEIATDAGGTNIVATGTYSLSAIRGTPV